MKCYVSGIYSTPATGTSSAISLALAATSIGRKEFLKLAELLKEAIDVVAVRCTPSHGAREARSPFCGALRALVLHYCVTLDARRLQSFGRLRAGHDLSPYRCACC